MARYEPVVLLSSETTCLVEDNDEVGYFDFQLKEEFCGEDVITAVDLYNKKLFLDERRKEAYAELSEEDKKFISIDEIEFFDGKRMPLYSCSLNFVYSVASRRVTLVISDITLHS